MKKTSYSDTPFVCIFPQRKLLNISYGRNSIFISLPEALPPEYVAQADDLTGKPLPFTCDGIPIYNEQRHNRIVASYHPEINQLIILHLRHIYSVKLPPHIRKIHCR